MASKQGGYRPEGSGLGGMVCGLGNLLDFLSSITEKGEQTRAGEIGSDRSGVKAVYGFTVRMGPGKPLIERFGNVRAGQGGATIVDEAREPMTDLFDEDDRILVVAELPGVSEADIRYEITAGTLHLTARSGDRRYSKMLSLPAAVTSQGASSSYRNGVLELSLPKIGTSSERDG